MIYLDIDKNVKFEGDDGVIEIHDMPVIVVECSYCDVISNRCFIGTTDDYSPTICLPNDNWMVFGNTKTGVLHCCPVCNEGEVYKD